MLQQCHNLVLETSKLAQCGSVTPPPDLISKTKRDSGISHGAAAYETSFYRFLDFLLSKYEGRMSLSRYLTCFSILRPISETPVFSKLDKSA
jgi:hypothetical protein